jgi:hypothetical protein
MINVTIPSSGSRYRVIEIRDVPVESGVRREVRLRRDDGTIMDRWYTVSGGRHGDPHLDQQGILSGSEESFIPTE